MDFDVSEKVFYKIDEMLRAETIRFYKDGENQFVEYLRELREKVKELQIIVTVECDLQVTEIKMI